jgi:peptidoglycan/LPS O-acetylase OafA/YrhL
LSNSADKLQYIQGLDGIRALAAFLVISTHWPNNSISLKFGWIGVNIFFVLSGFLITRILVAAKHKSLKVYLGDFFYKRALRIFPIYYLFFVVTSMSIIALVAFIPRLETEEHIASGLKAIKYGWPYYLTYTYNIKLNLRYFLDSVDLSNQFFGHLWSLSLEEQFYLVFPFIVYFLDISTLKKVIIAIIILCPLIRLWTAIYGVHLVTDKYWLGEFIYTNTLCQADALAMGAALAIFPFKIKFPYRNFFIVAFIWLVVGLICFYFLRKAGYFLVEGKSLGYDFPGFWFEEITPHFLINIRAAYQYTLVNILAVFLIAPAVAGKPLFPRLFLAKPVSYLGKISYGIYLFHHPLIAFFMAGASLFGGWFIITANPFMHISILCFYLVILIMLAHLSFKYFEKKILSSYKHTYDKR